MVYYKTLVFIILLSSSAFSQTLTAFSGAANCEDTWIDESSKDANNGTSSVMEFGQTVPGIESAMALKLFNIDDTIPVGATAVAGTLFVYKEGPFNHTLNWQRFCKPFYETNMTWNHWHNDFGGGTDSLWASEGAKTDGGSSCVDCYNAGSGTGSDISGINYSFATAGGAGVVQALPIDTCILNAWINKTDSSNGIKFYTTLIASATNYTTVDAGGANVPKWHIWWNPAPEPPGTQAKGRHSPSNRHGKNDILIRHGNVASVSTVEVRDSIEVSSDDMDSQLDGGTFSLTNTGIVTGNDGEDRVGAWRFTDIPIANSKPIDSAFVIGTINTTESGTPYNCFFAAQAVDDAATFIDFTDFDARTFGTDTIYFPIGAVSVDDVVTSPDISSVLQLVEYDLCIYT